MIRETLRLIEQITAPTQVVSDHYTNYVNIAGQVAGGQPRLLEILNQALQQDELASALFSSALNKKIMK